MEPWSSFIISYTFFVSQAAAGRNPKYFPFLIRPLPIVSISLSLSLWLYFRYGDGYSPRVGQSSLQNGCWGRVDNVVLISLLSSSTGQHSCTTPTADLLVTALVVLHCFPSRSLAASSSLEPSRSSKRHFAWICINILASIEMWFTASMWRGRCCWNFLYCGRDKEWS